MATAEDRDAHPERGSLSEVVKLFLKLGTIAFGGPAAHIALMHTEVVERRRWVSEQQFLDLVGATNLIPGPSSTELAIYLGWRRAGWRGLVAAGACFIAPAFAIVLGLAVLYDRYGTTPVATDLLYGVTPMVLAIIAYALVLLGRTAIKSVGLAAIGPAARICVGRRPGLDRPGHGVLDLPQAGLGGVRQRLCPARLPPRRPGRGLAGDQRPAAGRRRGYRPDHPRPGLHHGDLPRLPDRRDLRRRRGHHGDVAPSFVFVPLIDRLLGAIRRWAWVRTGLDGINVVAVALMAGVSAQFARTALVDPLTIFLAVITMGALLRWRPNPTRLIAAGATVGPGPSSMDGVATRRESGWQLLTVVC